MRRTADQHAVCRGPLRRWRRGSSPLRARRKLPSAGRTVKRQLVSHPGTDATRAPVVEQSDCGSSATWRPAAAAARHRRGDGDGRPRDRAHRAERSSLSLPEIPLDWHVPFRRSAVPRACSGATRAQRPRRGLAGAERRNPRGGSRRGRRRDARRPAARRRQGSRAAARWPSTSTAGRRWLHAPERRRRTSGSPPRRSRTRRRGLRSPRRTRSAAARTSVRGVRRGAERRLRLPAERRS